jgi:hypothetical protein
LAFAFNIGSELVPIFSIAYYVFHILFMCMWDHFKTAVKRIIYQRVPTKMTRARHTHPWINTKVRRKISQKHREHAKASVPSWFGLMGLHAIQVTLFPMAGIGLQRCLYEGCDVKIKSSVFSFLVGKSTICSKALSDAIIFVLAGDFNLPDINWSEQTISSNQYTVGTNQTYLDIAELVWLDGITRYSSNIVSYGWYWFTALFVRGV